jgi:hypothetical protein
MQSTPALFLRTIILFPIHTDVLEVVRSLLVVLKAVFSKLKNNGQREVAIAVRDKHICVLMGLWHFLLRPFKIPSRTSKQY